MNAEPPCIVTGQQIGLLGGPLYTPYKVLGAVALAAELGGKAVYWLETHDADIAEISQLHFVNAGGRLETLVWEVHSGGATSGSLMVDGKLRAVLETFFQRIPRTAETPGLAEWALDCYREGITLGDASEALAHRLFDSLGVGIFRPDTQGFRQFAQPFLHRDLAETPDNEQATVFLLDTRKGGSIRRALFRKSGLWMTREGEKIDPEKFTLLPSVHNRSIIQDAFFKARTYVAGPGEVKYLSEMGARYDRHGVTPAAVKPRMSVTLLDHRDHRLLEQTDLTLDDLLAHEEPQLLKQVLSKAAHFDFVAVEKRLRQIKDQIAHDIGALGLDASPVEAPLYTGIKETLGRRRAVEKAKHQDLLLRAKELCARIRPMGKPQERVRNLFEFMNHHGGLSLVDFLRRSHDWQAKTLEIP